MPLQFFQRSSNLGPWSFSTTPAISKWSHVQNKLWCQSFRSIICYTLCNLSWFFQVLLKSGLTLNSFARFFKSGSHSQLVWSLLFFSKKGVLTMVPFGHFSESEQKASAWDPFFQEQKKVVSLSARLLTFSKANILVESGTTFYKALKKGCHYGIVCLLFQKWANGIIVSTPFLDKKKRDPHYGTVCSLLKK